MRIFYLRDSAITILAHAAVSLSLLFGGGSVRCQDLAGAALKSRLEAQRAWDSLLQAKGGKDKLDGLKNFLVIGYYTPGTPNPSNARLHVFPDKIWDATFWNYKNTDPTVVVMDGSQQILRSADRNGVTVETKNYKIPDWQYVLRVVYLLETGFDRPQPLRVRQEQAGSRKIEILETSFKGRRIEFCYEPEELQISKVVVYRENGTIFRTYRFTSYADFNGIKMPTRESVDEGKEQDHAEWRIDFKFDVDYDPQIFTSSLRASSLDAWQRKP